MRRFVALLLFLLIVDDADATTVYSKHMFVPFGWVHTLLLTPLPIKARPVDLLLLVALLFAPPMRPVKTRMVTPMRNVLFLGIGTIVLWFVYGVATGGDARAASWQTYLMLSGILAAFTIAKVFYALDHYVLLGKTIVAAGLYRATMCWIFHLAFGGKIFPFPDYIAAHDDTVIWVVVIVMMIAYGLTMRNRATTLRSLAITVFVIVAIQWNQRRLAWVSLTMALIMGFFLLPPGWGRKRVLGAVRIIIPLMALYALVGWGRPEGIFRPLHAFESVSTSEDLSTLARNAENLGLLETAHRFGAVFGTGWGHGYVELTSRYSIAQFMELWPYIPHNSVLGLLAYTGILGFAGYWMALPTAVFLNSRAARLGNHGLARCIGIVTSTGLIVCANQMFGDMGIFSVRTMYMLATAYGVALRLPVTAGVWEGPMGKLPSQPLQPVRVGQK